MRDFDLLMKHVKRARKAMAERKEAVVQQEATDSPSKGVWTALDQRKVAWVV